eukprot:NODE_1320_length_2012_cov_23.826363_g1116_i0.p1 GENE.NODE_1320_length_2012_cov_23.826363_g1116_i0~~NODE_1320_length_2012_cov_23.826363_g1116_i0.p1  ORF type:complete len:395 (+),score=43.75 NODE_1320_length_2012_cov_23.826363_g1116_i0:69-1187(+)
MFAKGQEPVLHIPSSILRNPQIKSINEQVNILAEHFKPKKVFDGSVVFSDNIHDNHTMEPLTPTTMASSPRSAVLKTQAHPLGSYREASNSIFNTNRDLSIGFVDSPSSLLASTGCIMRICLDNFNYTMSEIGVLSANKVYWEYIDGIQSIIRSHKGEIHYIGNDLVIAKWSGTVCANSLEACKTSLICVEHTKRLSRAYGMKLPLRISICKGELIEGSQILTGMAAHVAEQFCTLNKLLNTTILIDDHIQLTVNYQCDTRFVYYCKTYSCREINAYELRKVFRNTEINEWMYMLPETDVPETYTQATTAFRRGKWLESETLFESYLTDFPQDSVAKVLLWEISQRKVDANFYSSLEDLPLHLHKYVDSQWS